MRFAFIITFRATPESIEKGLFEAGLRSGYAACHHGGG
jgi:hypothetical protein